MENENYSSGEDTRSRILAAAAQIFAEKGFRGTTTRAIASEAGVNEVTLFRQFGSKRNLLNAVIHQYSALPDLTRQIGNQMNGNYEEDLLMLAKVFMLQIMQRREVLRLMLCESGQLPELRSLLSEIPASLRSVLSAYLERQMAAGVVRTDHDPQVMAQAFLGLFFAYGVNSTLLEHPLDTSLDQESVVRQFVSIFVEGTRI